MNILFYLFGGVIMGVYQKVDRIEDGFESSSLSFFFSNFETKINF